MRMFKKMAGVIGLFCLTVTGSSFGDMVFDPLILAQAVITAEKTTAALVNQTEQLEHELSNFKNYDGNKTQWSNILPLMQKLAKTVSEGNALSYNVQDMNDEFEKKFPGYQSQRDYNNAYQSWSSTTMDTLRNTLASAGIQANNFESEQNDLDSLKQLSENAEGRMQALQVANMIAAEQVGQMQKLRQLIVNQINAQNAYMAYNVQKEQVAQAAENDLFANPLEFPEYGKGQGFGRDDLPKLNH